MQLNSGANHDAHNMETRQHSAGVSVKSLSHKKGQRLPENFIITLNCALRSVFEPYKFATNSGRFCSSFSRGAGSLCDIPRVRMCC